MTPALSVFLLLAAATEPLPRELEQRLALARALPAPYSGSVILALLPSAKLSPAQIAPLAEEAYHLAGRDSATALRAWVVYRDSQEEEGAVALAFPRRPVSIEATCADLEVSDPGDYYRWALEAGDSEFLTAVRNVRSAVEVGRLAEAILAAGWQEYLPVLSRTMAAVGSSDREFIEAIRYTRLHNAVLEIALKLTPQAARSLLNQYRTFLVNHLAGRRCAGNRAEEFEGIFSEFNRLAEQVRGVSLLTPELARVRAVDTSARDVMPNAFALLHKLTDAAADETGVRSMLTEVSKFQLEQKPGSTATTEETKAYLYSRFAERMAGSPLHGRVMEEWLNFVVGSRLRETRTAVWFRCAKNFATWARGDLRRQYQVESAGDPALAAYIKLMVLLPESEVTRVLP